MVALLAGCSAADGSDIGGGSDGPEPGSDGPDDGEGFGPGPSGQGGPDAACVEFAAEAENQIQPSDIIIAIDQSGSMDTETNWVKNQLNGFAQQITSSGIDVHVVVIAGKPGSENGFCVPAPLGSGSCPNDDSPSLLHVNQHVDSHDALVQILQTHPYYQQALRPEARKHIVVISDDDSEDMSAGTFDAYVKSADPSYADYVFHAIVANSGSCPYAAEEGKEYKQLVAYTQGVLGDLCQQDFAPVWDELSTQVVASAALACEWDIPEPPDGEVFAANEVNVQLTANGNVTSPGYVGSAADCAAVTAGWYYDDPANPQQVLVCPQTCDAIQGAQAASVNISFGCETVTATPK